MVALHIKQMNQEKMEADAFSFEEYLIALEMKVAIYKALSIELSRIAEWTQLTNKCTNGRRYIVQYTNEKLTWDINYILCFYPISSQI